MNEELFKVLKGLKAAIDALKAKAEEVENTVEGSIDLFSQKVVNFSRTLTIRIENDFNSLLDEGDALFNKVVEEVETVTSAVTKVAAAAVEKAEAVVEAVIEEVKKPVEAAPVEAAPVEAATEQASKKTAPTSKK